MCGARLHKHACIGYIASVKRPSPAEKKAKPWPVALERRKHLDLPPFAEERIQELHLIARKLLRAHEERQRFISRELHDNISQSLLAAAAQLALVEREALPAAAKHRLAKVRANLECTLGDLRNLSRHMRQDAVDHLGLSAVLGKHAVSFTERTGIPIDVRLGAAPLDRLTGEQVAGLFRIAQEALQNVEKHSGAKAACISLQARDECLVLEISDDGKSFGPNHVRQAQVAGHIGLFSMRERAEMLGGSLAIHARPGLGTTVCAAIPFPAVRTRRKARGKKK